jgi:uncharacterized membrane protein YqhA
VFEQLLKLRYVAVVIVFLTALHALAFLFIGTKLAVTAYGHIVFGAPDETRPGMELLHSLDFLFVSMVLLVLSLGIAKLFLLGANTNESNLPVWLRIDSIGELKVLLWETVLTTLLIAGLPDLVAGLFGKLEWTVLILPVAILILAVSLYFMKKADARRGRERT